MEKNIVASLQNETDLYKETNIPDEAILLNDETIKKLQIQIDNDDSLKKKIFDDNEEIQMKKKYWQEYSDIEYSNQKTIPFIDFIEENKLVEKNITILKKASDKKWIENLYWSNKNEKQFVSNAKKISNAKFIEIFQISLFRNNQIINKETTVGSGLEVSGENIDQTLKKLNIDLNNPDTIYMVHNHYNPYEKLNLPQDYEVQNGLVIEGGLSLSDIYTADRLYNDLHQKTHVFMIAINESGLTYIYKAGNSQHRNWLDDYNKK